MRGALALTGALCLACGAREPGPPNVCPYLLPDDPDPPGYPEALRAVEASLAGRTDLVVSCGDQRYPLRLTPTGPREPERFRPRGRCRTVLHADVRGTLEHEDDAEDRCHSHEVQWSIDATEDGRFSAEVSSIPLGIDLARDPDGRWTAVAVACEERPPVCAAIANGGCTVR